MEMVRFLLHLVHIKILNGDIQCKQLGYWLSLVFQVIFIFFESRIINTQTNRVYFIRLKFKYCICKYIKMVRGISLVYYGKAIFRNNFEKFLKTLFHQSKALKFNCCLNVRHIEQGHPYKFVIIKVNIKFCVVYIIVITVQSLISFHL